ncbi:MAG: TolC family protein [Candidatus Eisenbacteria sp.]|nr:TolC family protein [Candidatus Eisenbacteria bacterium]
MKEIRFTIQAVIVTVVLSGCAVHSGGGPNPRPLGGQYETFQAPKEPTRAELPQSDRGGPTGTVTLENALAYALRLNPDLAAFSWEVRAAEARAVQAGLRPNPEIGVEVEGFGGTGGQRELDAAVIKPMLSQRLELGGKRSKRARVAALEKDLAGWNYESKRLDVLTETRKAFVAVLGAQERLALTADMVRLSVEIHEAVSIRVEAGRVSSLEETRAGVTLATARIQHEHARRDLNVARKRLAAAWGANSVTFDGVEGRLEGVTEIPPLEALLVQTARNPEVARWNTETERRHASVEMEKAGRIPDLTLSGGIQRFNETGDHAYVVELSIPFPLFDRNQGSVRETEYRLAQAGEQQRAADVKARLALGEAYGNLAAAYAEASSLKDVVLPAAREALSATEEAYREGRLGYLDMLDAQRIYFEVREHWIGALTDYHEAVADVEQLVGDVLFPAGQGQ